MAFEDTTNEERSGLYEPLEANKKKELREGVETRS